MAMTRKGIVASAKTVQGDVATLTSITASKLLSVNSRELEMFSREIQQSEVEAETK